MNALESSVLESSALEPSALEPSALEPSFEDETHGGFPVVATRYQRPTDTKDPAIPKTQRRHNPATPTTQRRQQPSDANNLE